MMSDHYANLPRAFVARHDSLGPLALRAEQLIELRRIYREIVPAGLAQASQLANFRQGVLIIEAANSATAAKLKQLIPRLSATFFEKGKQVSAIRIQVQDSAKGW